MEMRRVVALDGQGSIAIIEALSQEDGSFVIEANMIPFDGNDTITVRSDDEQFPPHAPFTTESDLNQNFWDMQRSVQLAHEKTFGRLAVLAKAFGIDLKSIMQKIQPDAEQEQ